MRDLLATRNSSDLVQCLDIRGETTMDAQNLAIHKLRETLEHIMLNRLSTHSSQSKVVEYLSAILPRISIGILLLALVVEAVDLSDLATLMVSAKECDLVGIS